MAVNDELGITHPSLGDNPDLAYIIDQVIEQLKPMIVPRFVNAAARAIAYPDITDAPKLNVVAEELQAWSEGAGAFFPVGTGTGRVQQNILPTNGAVSAGSGAQIGVTFDGPAGQYVVIGTAAASNVDPTKAQTAASEVRLDGTSSGTMPFALPLGSLIQTVTRMWAFSSATNGTHTAQMVVTGPSFDINFYNGSSVLCLYFGSYI